MSTWLRAAHAFSYEAPNRREKDSKPTLRELHREIGVSYRSVLRMRDIIKQAAGKYRGHKHIFGAWPRSFMGHQRAKNEKTIKASGVLAASLPARVYKQGEVNRTERLLRLLLATPKVTPRKRRVSPVEVRAHSS
jgi:hypothetical protein